MNRRAALEMSVQSIVIFVLAFIVMGLIIGVINAMFGQITDQVELIPSPGVELGGNPTADRPLLVQNGEVNMPIRGETSAFFGIFYNKDEDATQGQRWKLEAGDDGNGRNACQGFNSIEKNLQIQRTTFVVDRTITYGDIVKFQTNMKLENYDNLQRGNSLTCDIRVVRVMSGGPDEPIAFGSFIMNIN